MSPENKDNIVQPTVSPADMSSPPNSNTPPSGTEGLETNETATNQTLNGLPPSLEPTVISQPQQSTTSSSLDTNNSNPNEQPELSKLASLKSNLPQPKKAAIFVGLVLLFSLSVFGAYLFGKRDQKVLIQEPPAQELNLPPQAVVVAECVEGRGKQYVLPKDIPGGPIYDVVNDKVVAIEYNLNVAELITNSDNFSDTILRLAKGYPIDHLVLIPVIPKDGGQVESALLLTYVVSKEEAKAITCNPDT